MTERKTVGYFGSTIKVAAGHYFDLLTPDPGTIEIGSIGAALSKLCRFDGDFRRLSPNNESAERLLKQLQLDEGEAKDPTVRDLVEIYLRHCENRPEPLRANRLKKKRAILDTFVAMYGKRDARKVKERHIKAWLAKHYPNVNDTTKRDRIVEPQAVWSYSHRRGLIKRNPLSTIKKPTASMRVHHVPFARWPELLDACNNDALRDLVEFMLYTGARVQEALIIQCDDWDLGRFSLPPERSKGGKTVRTIVVPTSLRAKIESKIVAVGSGHLFRNTCGKPWTKNSVNCAFRRLKRVMKDPELCATSCRHSFATFKLSSGIEIATVAKPMGHSSTKMVYSRYGKWLDTGLLDAGVDAGL